MASKQVLELIAAAHRDRATKLDLSGQNLTELPESVCEIDSLLELDLRNNQLIALSDTITNLKNLIYLNLKSNCLLELPESIGELTRLWYLNIDRNPLIKLPESIGNLVKLTKLSLRKTTRTSDIRKLPASIGNLVNLKELYLSGCQLTEIPDSIWNLTKLELLNLHGNKLTSLPDSIGKLDRLTHLTLCYNEIAELPQSMSKLTNLKMLNIRRNPLSISQISFLHSLPKLAEVHLCWMIIHARYLVKFSEWKSEWILDETRSSIRHDIVKHLGIDRIFNDLANIPEPFQLSLNSRLKIDSIAGISKLKNLTRLSLHGDRGLTEIPHDIDRLVNLKALYIYGNNILSIPDSIGRLKRLKKIELYENKIHKLPESIGDLSNLKTLVLNCNSLDKIPDTICQCENLKELSLRINKIAELPVAIGQLYKLKRLDFAGNIIRRLPESLVSCLKLTYLDLSGNPIDDLSILQHLPALQEVWLFGVRLPRRYWTKFSEWKAEWLLDETNAEIRRTLIEQVGYEKTCDELGAIEIDSWNEYTLLKIDNIQIVYEGWREVGREPMILLKMTCPSTAHIHILRVPPDMTSAENAIVWVNHGIHPSKFAIQT